MGLFDKKYCDVCGEKIGLLGNRKLEDGNLCKDCARKLSPFFNERRSSTVEEIKQQLAYREENERHLADFHPDMTFGEGKKIYIDKNSAQFIVTYSSNWRNANPDLIKFSMVRGVNTNIHENKNEIYYEDEEGNRKSYNPRRYECNYEFNVIINVDSPWFDKIEFELSDGNRPDSPYTDLYRRYEEQIHTLSDILQDRAAMPTGNNNNINANIVPGYSGAQAKEQEVLERMIKNISWTCKSCSFPNSGTATCQNCGAPMSDESVLANIKNIARAEAIQENAVQGWKCPSCGSQNVGKFCENCGAGKPEIKAASCKSCGYVFPNNTQSLKFCPECGTPL